MGSKPYTPSRESEQREHRREKAKNEGEQCEIKRDQGEEVNAAAVAPDTSLISIYLSWLDVGVISSNKNETRTFVWPMLNQDNAFASLFKLQILPSGS